MSDGAQIKAREVSAALAEADAVRGLVRTRYSLIKEDHPGRLYLLGWLDEVIRDLEAAQVLGIETTPPAFVWPEFGRKSEGINFYQDLTFVWSIYPRGWFWDETGYAARVEVTRISLQLEAGGD